MKKLSSVPIAVTSRTFSKNEYLKNKLLESFSNVKFNDSGLALSGKELVDFLSNREGAIVALEKINSTIISECPSLKILSKYGVGLDNIDQLALNEKNIKLGWTGGVNATSVAELALCFMIAISRNVFTTSQELRNKTWNNNGGFQLAGKTIGIIGCGHIGSRIAKILHSLECTILIHDLLDKSEFCKPINAKQVSKSEILELSDVVTLHIPYESSTHHFLDEKEFSKMKNNSILINTSRGNIVNENALFNALNSKLLGAGMDVFSTEPPLESPLLSLKNFFGTPHVGGSSKEAIQAMGESAIQHLINFFIESK